MAEKFSEKKDVQMGYEAGVKAGVAKAKAKQKEDELAAQAKEQGKVARSWKKLAEQGDAVNYGVAAVTTGGTAYGGYKAAGWLGKQDLVPEIVRKHAVKTVGIVVAGGTFALAESNLGKAIGIGAGAGLVLGDVFHNLASS